MYSNKTFFFSAPNAVLDVTRLQQVGSTSGENNRPSLFSRKLVDEGSQLLCSLEGNRVIVASTDAANAAVTLESGQAQVGGLLQESLFRLVDITTLNILVRQFIERNKMSQTLMNAKSSYLGNAEANVHSGPDRLVWNNLVHIWVSFQSCIDKLSLLVGQGLLSINLVGECSQKLLQH